MMTSKPTNREVKLARALVHPEKPVRDETLQSLEQFVKSLTDSDELELLKLWKALYYCFWLADKLPVQTELAEKYSQLMHQLKSHELMLSYCRSFYRIILREWSLLDQYRVNKFYLLLRLFLHEVFVYYYKNQESQSKKKANKQKTSKWCDIDQFLLLLQEEVLRKVPNGVRFHICDIYLQELTKVTDGKLSTEQFMTAIQPFLTAIVDNSQELTFIDRVYKAIFQKFLNEYSREAEQQHKTEKEALMQQDAAKTDEEEEEEDAVLTLAHLREEHAYYKAVNTQLLQKTIFDLASSEQTNDRFRKKLYDLHKTFAAKTGIPFITEEMLDGTAATSPNAAVNPALIIESSNTVRVGGKRKQEEEEKEQVAEADQKVSESMTTASGEDGKKTKKAKKQDKKSENTLELPIESQTTQEKKEKIKKIEEKVPPSLLETVEVATKTEKKKAKKVTIVEDSPKASASKSTAKASSSLPTSDASSAEYIAAPKFAGAKTGYVFRKGNNGVGYYRDVILPVTFSASSSSGQKKKKRN